MGKKILTLLMAAAVCLSVIPATAANAAKTTTTAIIDEEESGNGTDDSSAGITYPSDSVDFAGEILAADIGVSPAKKTIRIGKSFYINVMAKDESKWVDLDDEEWNRLCKDNIKSIVYRSSKAKIASVNKATGKVVGKKKGIAIIETTIDFANGETRTYKTKVYVTK